MGEDRKSYTVDDSRRELLRAAGATVIAGLAASGVALP